MDEENEAFLDQVELYRKKDSNVFIADAIIMLETFHSGEFSKFCFICTIDH